MAPPKKYFSDNGGEFNNEQFRNLCDSFNIVIKTTAAEAPWSNGLCERHNGVLAEMLRKTMAEGRFSLKMALNWVVHAKNSLSNVNGFSPYQLAIGYTPVLPSVLHDKLPALEEPIASELLSRNLQAMSSARKAFVEAENSNRIRRALRHNIRPNSKNKFYTGDLVYYKRNDLRKWQGPGTVIGQDSQQVLVKHGGVYIRVHPCRLMLEDNSGRQFQRRTSNSERQQLENTTMSDSKSRNEETGLFSDDEDVAIQSRTAPGTLESSGSEVVASLNNNCSRGVVADLSPVDVNTVDDNGIPEPGLVPEGLNSNGQQNYADPHIIDNNESTTGNSNHVINPRKNSLIRYRSASNDWATGKVLSRSGKATGKYKHNWNVETATGEIVEMDFSKEIGNWEYVEQDNLHDSEEINLCHIFNAEADEKTLEAKQRELKSWIDEEVYEEVEDKGQTTVSVRWVVTPKIIDGVWSTKARLVARGFEEDSSTIRADSPTCMRETLRTALAYAAFKNWNVNSIDIKTAFLQGKPIERNVYLRPPKEAGVSGVLWKLKKVVYGLSDASRVWYLRVVEELQKLAVRCSRFDKAFFLWNSGGQVEGVILVHVDDFLWCGSQLFVEKVITPLKSMFKISKECNSSFKYIGIDIHQEQGSISLEQNRYITSIKEVIVGNKPKDSPLDDQERKTYRGLVGQINWASGITRPDVSFNACQLSTVQAIPKISDIVAANKTVADLKREDLCIRYVPLKTGSLKLIVFADASYANLSDGGSQGGHLIFLGDEDSSAVLLAWGSKRIRRVARSTLSAETLSAVDALDTAHLIKSIVGEVFGVVVPVELYTDNKSLYDSICTTNLVLDKRLRVEIASLRENFENGEVKFSWVSAEKQIADVLTKRGASKVKLFSSLRENKLDLE